MSVPKIFPRSINTPWKNDQGVWIHQNSWFLLGEFSENKTTNYKLHSKMNGVYAFVIEGKANINGHDLNKRDGIGIWEIDSINISNSINSKILLMEVPMIS
ncbi:MAG: hypothetical protein H8E16_00875 [Flavobacteriales bacterium]|nr:hypothetical protein [Flavobacteriales bacterium]